MKVKVFDRVLLALYALLGLAALAYGVLNALLPESFPSIARIAQWVAGRPYAIALVAAAGVVFLAWTVRLLVVAFQREPKYDRGSVSIQNTENGAVRVSVAAMDALVRQAIGQSEGVVEVKTRIVNHEDSITVKIDMTLASDAHIPNVTMLMQRNIKSFIEEFSGIAVREVEIMVTSIQQVERPVPALVDRQANAASPEQPVARPAQTIYASGPVYETESTEPVDPQPEGVPTQEAEAQSAEGELFDQPIPAAEPEVAADFARPDEEVSGDDEPSKP